MRHEIYVILLAFFCILCGSTVFVCGQETSELPLEDRDPAMYDDSDDIRQYARLEAHGDYTRLKLIIRTKKKDFNLGEHVYIRFYVRNDSDDEVHIRQRQPASPHCALFWKLFHSNDEEVAKTPEWEGNYQRLIQLSQLNQLSDHGNPDWNWLRLRYLKLQLGQECELDWRLLNYYYDLTKPDTYELTCFYESFLYGQYYEPPLQSNTLTFRIHEPTGEEPAKYPYEPQHIPYTNPPPGEEVFKQPKPPKNVF